MGGYGLLLGCFGFGAILGAILMPRVRQNLTADGVVIAGTLVFAIAVILNKYLVWNITNKKFCFSV
ncbi:MFS transporter [Nostoc sp. 'Lobaria pulmonaria (5183) cyanobiont']|uniref:MFS transporter n=1 Tax=Nostoc sp. 'Lobaria pulmonaria (5183) cyanobiont' TaxID=1618022 RepID=UPI000CF316C2|nr:MFS transporter [Nostoc sp. 'Lobaria pulmonaria (5183) cyanobiont']